MRPGARSWDDNVLRERGTLSSRGERPPLFEQWGPHLEETGALLRIERPLEESLHNYLGRSGLDCSNSKALRQHSFTIAVHLRSKIERSHCLRIVRRHGDAGFLRFGKAQPMVHFCFCCGLCAGFSLWFSARRMAVWRGGSCVVSSGAQALVAGAR
jgi:hypothetical protein